MKLIPTILLTTTILILLSACRGCSNQTPAPAALSVTASDSIKVELPSSVFNIPVKYELKNFELWINQVIKGKFLETVINPLNDERDEAKLIMTKTGTIQITSNGEKLFCIVPLRLEAVLLKSRMGKGLTKSADTMVTTVNIQLSTPVALDKNWKLSKVIIHQCDIGCFNGSVTSCCTHREPDIRLCQSRRIIDAIAKHANYTIG